MIKLSIIIACYNAEATIAEQLDAFTRQNWHEPWELIIVNNRSTDNTLKIVNEYKDKIPNLITINAFDKPGTSYARNLGAKKARGGLIAFCDSDDVVCDDWVSAMGTALMQYDFVSGPFEAEKLNTKALRVYRADSQVNGIQHYKYPPYLDHAGGGNLGIKRSIFEQVGGFDERIRILEDTDFCWRVQLQGYKLHAALNAILHVRYRETPYQICKQTSLYAQYNVFLYKKYRQHGMPKIRLKKGLRNWVMLAKRWRQLFSRNKRLLWFNKFCWLFGRLYGSIKYRVWAL